MLWRVCENLVCLWWTYNQPSDCCSGDRFCHSFLARSYSSIITMLQLIPFAFVHHISSWCICFIRGGFGRVRNSTFYQNYWKINFGQWGLLNKLRAPVIKFSNGILNFGTQTSERLSFLYSFYLTLFRKWKPPQITPPPHHPTRLQQPNAESAILYRCHSGFFKIHFRPLGLIHLILTMDILLWTRWLWFH